MPAILCLATVISDILAIKERTENTQTEGQNIHQESSGWNRWLILFVHITIPKIKHDKKYDGGCAAGGSE